MYTVIATQPTSGVGSSFDSREIGPFATRRAAEDAAARLVDDPRRYARIRIVEEGE